MGAQHSAARNITRNRAKLRKRKMSRADVDNNLMMSLREHGLQNVNQFTTIYYILSCITKLF